MLEQRSASIGFLPFQYLYGDFAPKALVTFGDTVAVVGKQQFYGYLAPAKLKLDDITGRTDKMPVLGGPGILKEFREQNTRRFQSSLGNPQAHRKNLTADKSIRNCLGWCTAAFKKDPYDREEFRKTTGAWIGHNQVNEKLQKPLSFCSYIKSGCQVAQNRSRARRTGQLRWNSIWHFTDRVFNADSLYGGRRGETKDISPFSV